MCRARGPDRPPGVIAFLAVLALALGACASGPPPAIPAAGGPETDPVTLPQRAAPPEQPTPQRIGPAERERARPLVADGLVALAAGLERLLDADPAGMEEVRTSLERVRRAREVLATRAAPRTSGARPGSGPTRASVSQAVPRTVAIPLSALEPGVLEMLRPFRFAGAEVLRVELAPLERRLARAVTLPPERALGELFLARATALHLSEGAPPSLAGDSRAPSLRAAEGGAGS